MGRLADISPDGFQISTPGGPRAQINISFLLTPPHPLSDDEDPIPMATVRLVPVAAKLLQRGLDAAIAAIEETAGPIEIPPEVESSIQMRRKEEQ